MSVRPLVPRPQLKGKLATILHLHRFQYVGHQFKFFIVAYQTGVAIDAQQSDILGSANHGAQIASVATNRLTALHFHYGGFRRQTLIYAGHFTGGDLVNE